MIREYKEKITLKNYFLYLLLNLYAFIIAYCILALTKKYFSRTILIVEV